MKKLKKINIDTMERELPVLDYDFMMSVVGGLDPNDCWWRCMAYVKSSGSDYTASAAMSLAQSYYGGSFNSSSYAFSGSKSDMNNYVSNYVTNGQYCSTQILVFDPSTLSGWSGNPGTSHAIIIDSYDPEKKCYSYFDPQSGKYGSISAQALSGGSTTGYFINIKQ